MGGGWLVVVGMGLSRFWGGDDWRGVAFMSGCVQHRRAKAWTCGMGMGYVGGCVRSGTKLCTYTRALSLLFERLFFVSCLYLCLYRYTSFCKLCLCRACILYVSASVEFWAGQCIV